MPARGLPGLPWDMGDMALAPSRSGGVKCLGRSCLSHLCDLMGPRDDQCHCCCHPAGASPVVGCRLCWGEGGISVAVLRGPPGPPWLPPAGAAMLMSPRMLQVRSRSCRGSAGARRMVGAWMLPAPVG